MSKCRIYGLQSRVRLQLVIPPLIGEIIRPHIQDIPNEASGESEGNIGTTLVGLSDEAPRFGLYNLCKLSSANV